jgi:uncharacterized membrane protein YgdD (TMEM256/DUF423 family)
MPRAFLLLAALAGFIGVALGAFGAHALKRTLTPEMLAVFETGVRYQMYHAFALVAVAWAESRWHARAFRVAGWLLVAGILVFSGSLYALAFTGVKVIGAITPLGGLALLAGWAALTWGAWRANDSRY